MDPAPFRASVLDLAPVPEGSTPADALRNARALAAEVERLGFHRYWVAEHHNMPGIASSCPAMLLAHVAPNTTTIRLGSGGVMLPNHSALSVVEQFGMLEALYPDRIDLGIGRAPGTDQLTARALRRSGASGFSGGADDFPQQLTELIGFFTGQWPEGHPYRAIHAVPGLGYSPRLWMLGSSDYGAFVAGTLGMPYSFAHHFAPENTMAAVAAYRDSFRPSKHLSEPYLMLGVSVLCAESEQRARWLAKSGELSFVRLRSGRPGRFPSPAEAEAYQFTPLEKELLRARTASNIVGSPEVVRAGLDELVARTGAHELMITTMAHSFTDRVRSFELVADALVLSATT